ncbi:MAG: cation-translocating P-type ATPase [Gammaproteobacteria bacterium]
MAWIDEPLTSYLLTAIAIAVTSAILLTVLAVLICLGLRRLFSGIRGLAAAPTGIASVQKKESSPELEIEKKWHVLTAEKVAEILESDTAGGLSQTEADDRHQRYGPNRLVEKPPKSVFLLFFSQFKSILIAVLVIAAALAAAIGDITDGIVILAVVIINALLGFYQEFKAEKSLAELKKMLALQAEVRRDGRNREMPADRLVPGDIVILDAGDKIPADGRIITAQTLEVDESSLTGESVPAAKQNEALAKDSLPLAERSNMLYMNNSVTKGHAKMMVTATGMSTEIGKLAGLLAQAEDSATPLQKQLDHLGKRMALIALAVIVILFISNLLRGEALIQTAFTSIALAVAAIPEGLPTVVTVTLALGLHRMARQHAIVKRLAAVETLGCTTVICTDKTGTLTLNQMTARSIYYKEQCYRVTGSGYQPTGEIFPAGGDTAPANLPQLLLPLALCNNSHIYENQALGDPMEAALLVLAAKGGIDREDANRSWPRLAEIPFDAANKFMATFHQKDDEIKVFIKGAPEVLIKMCSSAVDSQERPIPIRQDALLEQNDKMAGTGLRVLAIAERSLNPQHFSENADPIRYLEDLTFIGLIGLMDPPRQEASKAIQLCRKAGIQIKMITGDQKITASAIAKELGLTGTVIEGHELDALDYRSLSSAINGIGVFARTEPEQKVRIIRALKDQGHIVAMTGDGVNDAPALKNADIGIAMGITGTHVAQEAATMVLTDDNFATIVKAVREGRSIYDNIVKFVRFQLSTNIGAILTVSLAPLLALPLPFTAVQLLWINIIMDGPPAMSLGIDPCRRDSMTEPPREIEARILSMRRFANLFIYGLTMAAGTLGVLYYGLQSGGFEHAKTLAFTTFVLFQVFNVFNARSEKYSTFNRHFFDNPMLWLSLFGIILLQTLVIHWTPAQSIFHTTALTRQDWLIAAGTASSVLILEELRKAMQTILRRFRNRR